MTERLYWTELRHVLAKRAHVKEKDATLFMNALVSQIIEGLKQDKQVKINGLGTFRLQAVAARRSINVSTGEEMVIAGYNKIVFSPEVGLKELIEKKGVQPAERTELDPLQKLGEQADEIIGILAEIDDMGKEEAPVAEQKEEIIEETKQSNTIMEKQKQAPKEFQELPKEQPKAQPKKKYHFLRDTLICVVLLLLLLLIGYFFLRNQIGNWIDSLKDKPAVEQVVEVQPEIEAEPVELQPEAQKYTEFIKIERITEGSRLAWISTKYYGSRVYWPYLYDANRDRLSNPSMILIGTPIRVPKLTPLQLDTTNEQTRINLQHLLEEGERAINGK